MTCEFLRPWSALVTWDSLVGPAHLAYEACTTTRKRPISNFDTVNTGYIDSLKSRPLVMPILTNATVCSGPLSSTPLLPATRVHVTGS